MPKLWVKSESPDKKRSPDIQFFVPTWVVYTWGLIFNIFYTLLDSIYLRVTLNLFYTFLGCVNLKFTFNLFYILLRRSL